MTKYDTPDSCDLNLKSELITRVADSLVENYLFITEQQGEVVIQTTMSPEELLFHLNELKNKINGCIEYH